MNHALLLILNSANEEGTSLRMNVIKRTIEVIEKSPTEYTFNLYGDIFAVVNVFQTYIFVHIRHNRDETYPLDGVCYHPNHFEDLVKLLKNYQKSSYHGKTLDNLTKIPTNVFLLSFV